MKAFRKHGMWQSAIKNNKLLNHNIMKNFKFIELPKEEVLGEVELSFIEGASNCMKYENCEPKEYGKKHCAAYDVEPCSDGCSPGLYCGMYTFWD